MAINPRWAGPAVMLLVGCCLMWRSGEIQAYDLATTIFWTAMMASDPLIETWCFRRWIGSRTGETRFAFEPWEFQITSVPQERIRWSRLDRVVETPEYFLLLGSRDGFHLVPRRLMDAEADARWRALASAELGSVGKRIEVQP